MIATFLQDELAEELKVILKDFRLHNPDGEVTKVNIFKQSLPVPESDSGQGYSPEELEEGLVNDKTKEDPYPYIIVRLNNGTVEKIDGEQDILVNLLIGVIDRDLSNQGHKDVLNIIQKIYYRFGKNPILAHRYEWVPPYNWALQDEESFPYFFGGIAMRFKATPVRREDANA